MRAFDRLLLAVAAFAVAAVVCSTADARAQSGTNRNLTLTVSGQARTAVVHVPKVCRIKHCKLVLMFHPNTSSGPSFQGTSAMDQYADSMGFITVYPSAIGGLWDTVADMPFVTALRSYMIANYHTTTTYAGGYSKGGGMVAATDACLRVLSAAMIVAENYNPTIFGQSGCSTPAPIPRVLIHGTVDSVSTYTVNNVNGWASVNQCSGLANGPNNLEQVGMLCAAPLSSYAGPWDHVWTGSPTQPGAPAYPNASQILAQMVQDGP